MIALIILAVGVVYAPGLNGPFVLDDDDNIALNPGVALTEITTTGLRQAWSSNDSGPMGRPLAAITFALNYYLAGGTEHTLVFKVTNIAVHALNSALVFLLLIRLLAVSPLGKTSDLRQRATTAVLGTSLWALHPIQVTNVLYVVQRMNSLSATFVLAGLLVFLAGRAKLSANPRKGLVLMSLGVVGGMGLGALAKENAILLPLFALTIEFTLFAGLTSGSPQRRLLRYFYLLTVAIPAAAAVGLVLVVPDLLLADYVGRPFTLFERLLTESRVLWHYLSLLLGPWPSRFGIFHDDIPLSTNWLSPPTTLISVLGIVILLLAALTRARQYPIAAFGTLWFLAGHCMESGPIALEIAFEHRNYVPSIGVAFGIAYGITSLGNRVRLPWRCCIHATTGMMLIALAAMTMHRAYVWHDAQNLADQEVSNHPVSPRALHFAAQVSLKYRGDLSAAIRFTIQGIHAAPQEPGFRLYLRTLMGHLSEELSALINKNFSMADRVTRNLRIDGLPNGIEASITSGRVHLSHPEAADQTIALLLESRPISGHTLVSFEGLVKCAIAHQSNCGASHTLILHWTEQALKSPKAADDYRAVLASNAAQLHAAAGQWNAAIARANQARTLAPRHLSYQLLHVEYLLQSGQIKAAGQRFNQITQAWAMDDLQWKTHKGRIEELRAHVVAPET